MNEKEEKVSVAARDVTCSEGIRRMKKKNEELEKEIKEIEEETDKLIARKTEYKNKREEEKDEVIRKRITDIIEEINKKINENDEKVRNIKDEIYENKRKIGYMKMHDELLAKTNIRNEKRSVFVLETENESVFYYPMCLMCCKDVRKCNCRDEEGNGEWVYKDIVKEVGDEDLVSHLPKNYFKM